MIKKILSLALMAASVLCLQAQALDETPVVSPQEVDEIPVVSPLIKKNTKADKVDVNVSVGSSYMYSKNFGSGFSTYVAPELTYKLSPKVHLNVGIMFLNSNIVYNKYRSLVNEQTVVVKTKPETRALAYVSGDYLLTDRLTISGMVMRDLSGSQGYGQNNYNPSIQAMSLHLDYKITDNITIGAGMHMSQGNNYLGYPSSGYGLYPGSQYDLFNNY